MQRALVYKHKVTTMNKIHPLKVLSVFLVCSLTSTVFALPVKSADEIDEVTQAANAGVTTLSDFLTKNNDAIASTRSALTTQAATLKTTNAAIKSLIESLSSSVVNRSAFRKDTRDRAATEAIAALLKAAENESEAAQSEYYIKNVEGALTAVPFIGSQKTAVSLTNAVAVEFAKLKEELRSQHSAVEEQIKVIDERIEQVKAQLEKLQKMIQVIESLLPKLLEYLTQDSNAQQTKACFNHISKDLSYAAKLLAAARANLNNPAGLNQFLKNNSPGSGIDVREVKETTGLIVIFRVGALTHCLSTKQQCGGKAYALAR